MRSLISALVPGHAQPRGFVQPAITATADALDSNTVEQLITTVQDLQETVEQQAEWINKLETEFAEHEDHTGQEFADVHAIRRYRFDLL